MASLSLREAAEQTGTSKSTIWRAIKAGRLSAPRDDDGNFAIDPAELFRVYQPQRPAEQVVGQDATTVQSPAHGGGTDETAIRMAALEAENRGLRELLAEMNVSRDELRADRDDWRGRAERLLTDQGPPSFWRRLFGKKKPPIQGPNYQIYRRL